MLILKSVPIPDAVLYWIHVYFILISKFKFGKNVTIFGVDNNYQSMMITEKTTFYFLVKDQRKNKTKHQTLNILLILQKIKKHSF